MRGLRLEVQLCADAQHCVFHEFIEAHQAICSTLLPLLLQQQHLRQSCSKMLLSDRVLLYPTPSWLVNKRADFKQTLSVSVHQEEKR